MNRPKNKPGAATARALLEAPYTGPGDGTTHTVNDVEATAIRALDRKLSDGLNLVYREFTITHERERESREELREFRKETRNAHQELRNDQKEFRSDQKELRKDQKEVRNELLSEISKVDARAEQRAREQDARAEQRAAETNARIAALEQAMREEFRAVREHSADTEQAIRQDINAVREHSAGTEQAMREEFRAVREHSAGTEQAIRKLAAESSATRERSWGTRQIVWGILGVLGTLVAGALGRPIFDRMLAAIFGG